MNFKHVNLKVKSQVQKQKESKRHVGLFETTICLIICILFSSASIDVKADVGRGAATGAAVGGLLGLVFGDDLGDVVGGAAIGAGAGAVGGAVSGSMKKKEAEKRTQEQQRLKQQQKAAKAQQAAANQQREEQALIQAIGEDNYRGLIALVECEHKSAEGLATAGGASSNSNHQLASLWLKAMIANDLKQTDRTAELYEQLISADRDIDTVQQASLETDKVLMDVRQERRAQGIVCQR